MWEILGDLHDDGQTILLTTHYMEEADEFCDRVAVIGCESPRLLGTHAEVPTMELEVLEHGHRPIEGVALWDDADQLLGERRLGDQVDTADQDRTTRRHHPRRQHSDRGALAGAVRTEQSVDLTGEDLEIDHVDRDDVATGARCVDLREPLRTNDRVSATQ